MTVRYRLPVILLCPAIREVSCIGVGRRSGHAGGGEERARVGFIEANHRKRCTRIVLVDTALLSFTQPPDRPERRQS